MYPSLRSIALPALLLSLLSPATAQGYHVDQNGPDILDQCPACPHMYTILYRCQQIAQPNRVGDEVRKCVCDPSDNGWYAYLDACRGCLPFTGTDDFLGNLGRMMNQVYSVCRSTAGNITSDGVSLCATEQNYEDCMALRDSSQGETWVSFRGLSDGKYDSNRTQLLNLAAVKANLTTSTTSTGTTESAASKTTATTAATGLDTTASTTGTSAAETSNRATSATSGSQSATPTANPNFAARLSQESRAGYVLGMLVVAGIVGGLI